MTDRKVKKVKYFKITLFLSCLFASLITNNVSAYDAAQATSLPSDKTQLPSGATRIYVDKKDPYLMIKKVAGKTFQSKINNIRNILKRNKADYLFVSAPENVAWLLNIRGSDNPNSPIPNCRLIIGKDKKLFLITQKEKTLKIIKDKKLSKKQIVNPKNFKDLIETDNLLEMSKEMKEINAIKNILKGIK